MDIPRDNTMGEGGCWRDQEVQTTARTTVGSEGQLSDLCVCVMAGEHHGHGGQSWQPPVKLNLSETPAPRL